MRWSGWILAAMVVGYAGVASGQPGCVGCGGRSAAWLALSGEPGCSPPGLSLSAWAGPSCCCANQRPCCNNAWDGYCEHHARVQAFWTQVGVRKCRCCPPVMPRMQVRVFTVSPDKDDSPIFVDHGFAAVPAKIGTVPSPPVVQPTPSLAPVPAPSNEAPKPPLRPTPDSPGVRSTPSVPAVPASPSSAPAVAPDSAPLSEAPMPPGEAFREVSQSWLR